MAHKLTFTIVDNKIYTTVISNNEECYSIPDENNKLFTTMDVCVGDDWVVIGENAALLNENSELKDSYFFNLSFDLLQDAAEEQIIVITDDKEINWSNEAILGLILKKLILNAKKFCQTELFESVAFNIPVVNGSIKNTILNALTYLDNKINNIHLFNYTNALNAYNELHTEKTITYPSIHIHTDFKISYVMNQISLSDTQTTTMNIGLMNLLKSIGIQDLDAISKNYQSTYIRHFFVDNKSDANFALPYFSKNDILLLKPKHKEIVDVTKSLVNEYKSIIENLSETDKTNTKDEGIYFSGILSTLPSFQKLIKAKLKPSKVFFIDTMDRSALTIGAAYYHSINYENTSKIEKLDKTRSKRIGILSVSHDYKRFKIIPLCDEITFPLNKQVVIKTSRKHQKKVVLNFVNYDNDVHEATTMAKTIIHINDNLEKQSKISVNFSINFKGEISVKAKNFLKNNNYNTTIIFSNILNDFIDVNIKEKINKIKYVEI